MSSIYLGDIDPNHNATNTESLRRTILFQLLMWDSVVFSDSQILTDPRMLHLMSDFQSQSGDCSMTGLELLFQEGLVEVAFRQNCDEEFSIAKLWHTVNNAADSKPPYFPNTESYPRYLDSIINRSRIYSLDSIAQRFQDNLLSGVESGDFILNSKSDDTDRILLRMFHEKPVLFRNILDFIRKRLSNGLISADRYWNIYNYVYSCYNVNISAETGCYLNTKYKNIPLHLEFGTGDFQDEISGEMISDLRPTWALNPYVFDHMTMPEFLDLRKEIHNAVQEDRFTEYLTGTLTVEGWKDFCEVWEDYTVKLEKHIRYALKDAKIRVMEDIEQRFIESTQTTVIEDGIEVVKTVFGLCTPLGTILDAYDLVMSGKSFVCNISKRKIYQDLKREKSEIDKLLSPETRIITKY